MFKKIAFIGVGNMSRAIISGIQRSDLPVDNIVLYDKFPEQYALLDQGRCRYTYAEDIQAAVQDANYVILAVKPQNFPEILEEISRVPSCSQKIYITIAAGITSNHVSEALNGAVVIRVLPSLPITIGAGVTVICNNLLVKSDVFDFVKAIFESTGSVIQIEESQMNRIIGVTSSSPAYVFKFIDCICKGAAAQGLQYENIVDIVCDVFIGSALLLKQSGTAPDELISRVASKGGTTEKALAAMDKDNIEKIIEKAMIACTKRADELGN